MKILLNFILILLITTGIGNAQNILSDSLVLRPSASNGQDVVIVSTSPNDRDTTGSNILTAVWTVGGNPAVWRSYIKFDLDSIPSNATVDSAFLSLYADTASVLGYTGTPTYGTNNASILYRVASPWTKSSINWNFQPAITPANAVSLPQSSSLKQNYLGINVTPMVQKMVDSGNHGWLIRHTQETTYYNSMIFHSSRSSDSMKRPLLKVYYSYPDTSQNVKLVSADSDIFQIRPNPTVDIAVITVSKPVNQNIMLTVVDFTGRGVYRTENNDRVTSVMVSLNLTAQPKGIYFVKVYYSDGRQMVRKLIHL